MLRQTDEQRKVILSQDGLSTREIGEWAEGARSPDGPFEETLALLEQLPPQVETAIVNLKQETPHWGARKIRERLLRRFSCEVKVPAAAPSTSPTADVSVSTAKKSISAPSSRARLSVSRRSRKLFGGSALWITISNTSIWRKKTLQALENPFGPKV